MEEDLRRMIITAATTTALVLGGAGLALAAGTGATHSQDYGSGATATTPMTNGSAGTRMNESGGAATGGTTQGWTANQGGTGVSAATGPHAKGRVPTGGHG
jgi:hypothetical protein